MPHLYCCMENSNTVICCYMDAVGLAILSVVIALALVGIYFGVFRKEKRLVDMQHWLRATGEIQTGYFETFGRYGEGKMCVLQYAYRILDEDLRTGEFGIPTDSRDSVAGLIRQFAGKQVHLVVNPKNHADCVIADLEVGEYPVFSRGSIVQWSQQLTTPMWHDGPGIAP